MSIFDYLLNGLLIALVVVQLRGRRVTLRSLVLPIAVVTWAALSYLRAVPAQGNDLLLVLLGAGVGLALGAGAGIATRVIGRAGQPFAKATVLAAILWVLGVGSRLAFELFTSHGGQGAVARFSAAHQITAASAWVDCLVLMALAEVVSRTAVIALKSWRVRRSPTGDGPEATPGARAGATPPVRGAASMMGAHGHAW